MRIHIYELRVIFMNIEAYDAESLRKLVRLLEYENRILKEKLKKENIPYDEVNPFEETIDNVEEYDPDQGERIVNPPFITEEMATQFFSMFWGREDVFAKRGKTEVIFHNAIIVGMIGYVLNNEARRCFVMSVKIQNGQNWMLRK